MFYIPFLAFPHAPNNYVWGVEVCSLFYWTFDVVASFLVGFYRQDGLMEMRPAFIARNYLKTWFGYDMVCITIDYVLFGIGFQGDLWVTDSIRLNVLRVSRSIRFLRVVKLKRRLSSTIRHVQSNQILTKLNIL